MKFTDLILSMLITMPLLNTDIAPETDMPEEVQTTHIEHQDNSCLALNYHRVREFGPIESTMRFLSNSRELSVYSVSSDAFLEQMKWLKENDANFITMEEIEEIFDEGGDFPERCIWINFDDMDTTIYDHAHPILEEMDIPATGFVITGEVGNDDFNNISLIDMDGLEEMEESGVWEFYSHTHQLHHLEGDDSLMLMKSKDEVLTDLNESQTFIESRFDAGSNAIAYPFGQADDDVVSAAQDAGFELGFSLEEKEMRPDNDPYYIPRVLVSENAFENLVKTWEGFEEQ